MTKNKEIKLGIGYTINKNTGIITGCTNINFIKPVQDQYSEVIKFLLEEYAKSNNMKTKDITFI